MFRLPRLVAKLLCVAGLTCLLGLSPDTPCLAQDAAPDPAQIPRPLPEDGPGRPELPRRSVLELEITRIAPDGTAGAPFRLVAVAEDGPAEGRKLQAIDRDDLPFPIYWTASLLDRHHKVAEIHFFRDGGADQTPIRHQIAFLDGEVETQVELDRGLTWSLRWFEARDEEEHVVNGEITYRPVAPRPSAARP